MNEFDNEKYLDIYNNDNYINSYKENDNLINSNIKIHIDDYKIYVAKRFYAIYNYLKELDIIKESYNPVEYLKELSNKYYVVNGRQMTDEEIIAYELHRIQKYLIINDYEKNKYKDIISYLYNKLLKTKISYQKDKNGLYRSCINTICCLLNETPPFLEDIYEQCCIIENRKYKVIRK